MCCTILYGTDKIRPQRQHVCFFVHIDTQRELSAKLTGVQRIYADAQMKEEVLWLNNQRRAVKTAVL